MSDTIIVLKGLRAGGISPIVGYKYDLSRAPGPWLPKQKAVLCESGYHGCVGKQILKWLNAELHAFELRGNIQYGDDKVVAEEARWLGRIESWDDRTARLFAADCAERTVPIFEKAHPDDKRPRQAIEAARDFANGKVRESELLAARAAAWAAAWDWQYGRLLYYCPKITEVMRDGK